MNKDFDKEFNEALDEVLPFGLYYDVKRNVFMPTDKVSKSEWIRRMKQNCRFNDLDFISLLKNMNEAAFIKELNIQLSNYKRNNSNIAHWLYHTDKIIRAKLLDKNLFYAYEEWIKEKQFVIIKPRNVSELSAIAVELTGYGKENINDSLSPSLRHIKAVLGKYNLKPLEAVDIINDNRETFSSNFNSTVTPRIIEYLKEIPEEMDNKKTKQEIKKTKQKEEPENKHKDIFIDGYACALFLEWHKLHSQSSATHLADYSYIIRMMRKDKLILSFKQSDILDFLNIYSISLSKLKTITTCETRTKKTLYIELKKSIYTS